MCLAGNLAEFLSCGSRRLPGLLCHGMSGFAGPACHGIGIFLAFRC
jgi:hypothetical protein